ncbi:MAG: 30S ribosomal protein S3 [Halobacteriota archaeon]|nr:30S ribosomal protein S3 [Halobacteriota archaeon]
MAIEKKFVADGIRKSLTDEYLTKRLEKAGYGGMEINRTPMGTQITVYAQKPGMVIGKGGKVIRNITMELDNSFNFDNPQVDVHEVGNPALNAQMMASSLANILERGWNFRKAGYNTLQKIRGAGALGCEIVISGKLTGQRSRCAKFLDGYIKHAGKSAEEVIDRGFAIAKRKSGVLGVKVSIVSPDVTFPDNFNIIREEVVEVKEEPKEVKEPQDEVKAEEKPTETSEIKAEEKPTETSEIEEAATETKETTEEVFEKAEAEEDDVTEVKKEEASEAVAEDTPEKEEEEK